MAFLVLIVVTVAVLVCMAFLMLIVVTVTVLVVMSIAVLVCMAFLVLIVVTVAVLVFVSMVMIVGGKVFALANIQKERSLHIQHRYRCCTRPKCFHRPLKPRRQRGPNPNDYICTIQSARLGWTHRITMRRRARRNNQIRCA